MKLFVAAAVGRGSTELAAFDDALIQAGVANFNLIRLSSVVPPGSEIVVVDRIPPVDDARWGDRLYVVYAEQRTSTAGAEAWAGVGWVQDERTGRGLFVEHEGGCESSVRGAITASLADLQHHRGASLGEARMHVVGAGCDGRSTCVLVVCAVAAEGWL
jgi:arginine decarboxylase